MRHLEDELAAVRKAVDAQPEAEEDVPIRKRA
jgi:hypothetical protein